MQRHVAGFSIKRHMQSITMKTGTLFGDYYGRGSLLTNRLPSSWQMFLGQKRHLPLVWCLVPGVHVRVFPLMLKRRRVQNVPPNIPKSCSFYSNFARAASHISRWYGCKSNISCTSANGTHFLTRS